MDIFFRKTTESIFFILTKVIIRFYNVLMSSKVYRRFLATASAHFFSADEFLILLMNILRPKPSINVSATAFSIRVASCGMDKRITQHQSHRQDCGQRIGIFFPAISGAEP